MTNGSGITAKRGRESAPSADPHVLAIQALTFIGGDTGRADRFFQMSGVDPSDLRHAAADPHFLVGVMDYLVSDEDLLLAFAERQGLPPAVVVRARETLCR